MKAGGNLEFNIIRYSNRDGITMDAFYSQPTGNDSYPAGIVTMEGMDLMKQHIDIARRLQLTGF